jgi:hypothetical protein
LYQNVCPFVGIGSTPPPPPHASEYVSPLDPKGGVATLPCGSRGGPISDDWKESLGFCILCGKYCKLFIFPYHKVNETVRVPAYKQLSVEKFRRGKLKRGEIGGISIGKMGNGRLGMEARRKSGRKYGSE